MIKDKLIYYFSITLRNEFDKNGKKLKERPFREIAVLSSQSLSTLARAIVTSFGFDFDHCYGFYDNLENPFKSKLQNNIRHLTRTKRKKKTIVFLLEILLTREVLEKFSLKTAQT